MKNISFDNPWLLLIAIPLALAVIIPFILIINKDNRTIGWKISLGVHLVIIMLASLAAAGIKSTSVLTKTTVYVLADVSYSSERNLDDIDDCIEEIQDKLPENAKLGIVCFGRNSVVLTPAGREIKRVSEAKVDDTATDIVSALNYTETLFKGDSLKRIVLITDGNDTVNESVSSLATTVQRLTENGIKIDTIFLNNKLNEGEIEAQLSDVEFTATTYLGHINNAKILIQASGNTNSMVEIYARKQAAEGEEEKEYECIESTFLPLEQGLNTLSVSLPATTSGFFEYRVEVLADEDISKHNNVREFTQEVVGKTKILLITGSSADKNAVEVMYGGNADIDSYLVTGSNARVPFTLEEIVAYDEIIISNVDIRNIRNVNAFIDSLDMAISQYGKSLMTFGDLRLQTDADDMIFKKFQELLPVDYGNNNREGRLYTIVLDVSHSMFMASKFTTAKTAAIKLLSILGDDDYVSLVTFSGEIKVETPKKVSACRQDLIGYIDSLTTDHGTDIGLGLEEALKTIKALNLAENQVMLISDGFSFDSTRDAVEVSAELYSAGATVSAINTYIPADGTGGRATLRNVVNAGSGGKYYEISRPEDVEGVVFGSVADDIGDVIIEKDAQVNIARYNDAVVKGFTSMPMVSGYIISMETYDATVPLTISHLKPGGYTETMPLYAYRSHGNGKVASFTSSISGNWTKYWSAEDKSRFINNVMESNTPKVRIDRPYSVNIERSDLDAYVEIVPSVLDPAAKTTLKITFPNGKTTTRELAFDARKYFYTIATETTGTYRIEITYSYDEQTFTSVETFHIPYLPEYNMFASYDTSKIYDFMRGNGTITEWNPGDPKKQNVPSLKNDKNEISTYQVSYRIPLLIAAAALFVVDIIVRKFKLGVKKKPKPQNK